MSDVSRGEKVVFYNGRRPMTGVVAEVQDDGRVVLAVSNNGFVTNIVKDLDEVKALKEVKGRHASIKFVDSGE